jgi:hypothetical protein
VINVAESIGGADTIVLQLFVDPKVHTPIPRRSVPPDQKPALEATTAIPENSHSRG